MQPPIWSESDPERPPPVHRSNLRQSRFCSEVQSRSAPRRGLFDQLVGAEEECLGDRQADRALATLRLITRSNLVGNCTGNSLILAPRSSAKIRQGSKYCLPHAAKR